MNVSPSDMLDLFDRDDPIDTQLDAIRRFVNVRSAGQVIVYYIGHGGFTRNEHQYVLASRRMQENLEANTGFVGSHLAEQLRAVSLNGQLFIILDCCYSAQMLAVFQSGVREVNTMLEGQTYADNVLPRTGAALLTASSKYQPAIAPEDSDVTMFSGSLLHVLETGIPGGAKLLSFDDIAAEVRKDIRKKYPDETSMPEVYAPVQSDTDLTRLGLFPNVRHNIIVQGGRAFLSRSDVRDHVANSGLLRPGESVLCDLLLYSTRSQQTWFVVTTFQLFCLLDDIRRTHHRIIQWAMPRMDADPIIVTAGNPGRVAIGRRTGWRYSRRLHPNVAQLRLALENIVQIKAQHLRTQPKLSDDKAFIFRNDNDQELGRAHDLTEFIAIIGNTLPKHDYMRHYTRGHFMQWFRESINDPDLALDSMAREIATDPDCRDALVRLIQTRYQT